MWMSVSFESIIPCSQQKRSRPKSMIQVISVRIRKKTVPFLDRSSPTILFLTNKMKRQLLVQVAPRHTGETIYCVSGTQNICAWIRTYFQSLCGRSSNLDSFEKQGFSGMIHSFLSHGTSWDQCQPSLWIPVLVKHGNGTSPSDRWFHHL